MEGAGCDIIVILIYLVLNNSYPVKITELYVFYLVHLVRYLLTVH